METVKYQYRCLNHVFGSCKENWEECKSYVTNVVANHFQPDLLKKTVKQ